MNDRQEKELMAEDIPTPSPSVRVFFMAIFMFSIRKRHRKRSYFEENLSCSFQKRIDKDLFYDWKNGPKRFLFR